MKKPIALSALVVCLGIAAFLRLAEQDSKPFYLSLDNKAAPSLNPAEALLSFSLPEGYEIELVAAEPLIADPVAMDWDEDGRLYVVEMRGFMRDAEASDQNTPIGRVSVLIDEDGDGVMDRSEAFLDGLVMPRAVAVINEGVLVAEPPNLWLCRGSALRCEQKQKVADYAVDHEGVSPEHLENGLLKGVDNWLYNAKSDRRLRMEPGGKKMREQRSIHRGQWGIAQDDEGRLFYNHNSNWLSGDAFPAETTRAAHPELPLPKGLAQTVSEHEQVFTARVNPGVNRAYIDGTLREDGRLKHVTAVSGLVVYRADRLPAAGDVFVPEPAGNVVSQHRLTQGGEDEFELRAAHITYPDATWGQREFLASSDERFRPVDAKLGPDGALYILDMYRGIIQDKHFLTDELKAQIAQRGLASPLGQGRIWRIRHRDYPLRPPMPLSNKTDTELLALLQSDGARGNGWLRDTLQRLLIKRQIGRAELQPLLEAGDLAAKHALWVLEGLGQLRAEDITSVLNNAGSGPLAVQALRLGGHLLSDEQLYAYYTGSDKLALKRELILALRERPQALLELAPLVLAENSVYLQQAFAASTAEFSFTVLEALLDISFRQSEYTAAFLSDLTQRAYIHAGDDRSAMEQLLALIHRQEGEELWRQQAMLEGLSQLYGLSDIEPVMLERAPTIFTDVDLDEDSPLWQARIGARRLFDWPGNEAAKGLSPLTAAQRALMAKGEAFYRGCAACHGPNGGGVANLAPPLAGAEWVTGPPDWLGRIILQGMSGPITVKGETWNGAMPAHQQQASLDDETLAGLMTYLRRSWGNTASFVSTGKAAAIRLASANRQQPWTAKALEALELDMGFAPYLGEYKISFVSFTVFQEGKDLMLKVPLQGSAKLLPSDVPHRFVIEAAEGSEEASGVFSFQFKRDETQASAMMFQVGGNQGLAQRKQ